MPASKSITVTIPDPCSQNWEDMKGTSEKRHCNKCSTDLINFSTWSDEQLYQFFTTNTAHICGRFSCHQLNRPIAAPIKPRSSLNRYFVALGLSLVLSLPTANARINFVEPHRLSVFLNNADACKEDEFYSQHNSDSTGIMVHVKTRRKNDETRIILMVLKDSTEVFRGSTDGNGNLQVSQLAPGEYRVQALYYGTLLKEVTDVEVIDGQFTQLKLTLKKALPEHIWVGGCPKF